MDVVAAATLWIMASAFLLFPALSMPLMLRRAAVALLVAEFVALMIWSYGSRGCDERPCGVAAEAARTAAAHDIPLLAVVVVVLAGAWTARQHRLAMRRGSRKPPSEAEPRPRPARAGRRLRGTHPPRRASRH